MFKYLLWILTFGLVLSMNGMNTLAESGEKTNEKTNESSINEEETKPAKQAIERLLGQKGPAHQIELQKIPRDGSSDAFEIAGKDGQIVLKGTSNVALISAFHWYVKYVAGAHLSWNGDLLHLPGKLPAPKNPIKKTTQLENRYMYNYTVFGYTTPYWTWENWEREIDYLAASGINLALVPIGHEIVWYETFQQFGCTKDELRNWIVPPAHQPWQWMGNISSFSDPISLDLMEKRVALAQKIVKRMHELGITPVYPGFNGIVPPCFSENNREVNIIPQGDWFGYPRPDWLEPTDNSFKDIARSFYKTQEKYFGRTTHFATDILHEGGKAGNVDLTDAAKNIQQAMLAHSPEAIWVIQAWQDNPRKEVIEGIDPSHALVLDIEADEKPRWKQANGFSGTPWAWGIIQNYGGVLGMYGNLYDLGITFPKVMQLSEKERGPITGLSQTMEGIHHNPVVMDLFGEMTWRQEPVDLTNWIEQYAERRYGMKDAHATKAWKILLNTAYSKRADGHTTGNGTTESLFTAQPSLDATNSSRFGPTTFRYEPLTFQKAYVELLQVHPKIRQTEAYQYDIVDITRQLIANRGRILLQDIRNAYENKDKEAFTTLTNQYLQLIDLTEEILLTHEDWLLGPWLEKAKSWASNEEERKALEYDARSIITTWAGEEASKTLHEYANREWAGIMTDYYKQRWQLYFSSLSEALEKGEDPEPIHWYQIGENWATKQNHFTTKPKGNPYAVSQKISQKLANMPGQGYITLQDSGMMIRPNEKITVSATFSNYNPFQAAENIEVTLHGPEGMKIEESSKTSMKAVAPGEEVAITWDVTIPQEAIGDRFVSDIPLTVKATYDQGKTPHQQTEQHIMKYAGKKVQEPYKTFSSTEADFAQDDKQFAILASGKDMWKSRDQYGSIYLESEASQKTVAITKVMAQGNTWPWAKAGMVVRNDLTKSNETLEPSSGYAIVAVTPENGFVFQWDSNGDGLLDKTVNTGKTNYPVWLKLERDGTTYTASYRTDGGDWKTIHSATIPSASETQDVGLFATATNAYKHGAISKVIFADFDIKHP